VCHTDQDNECEQEDELEADELPDRCREIHRQPCSEPRRRLIPSSHEYRTHEEGDEPLKALNNRSKRRTVITRQRGYDYPIMPEGSTDPEVHAPQMERSHDNIEHRAALSLDITPGESE